MTDRSSSSRTVLFLHPSDEGYGADRLLLTAAEGLQSREWRVVVAVPDDVPAGWLSRQLGDRGITVIRGPLAIARRRYLGPRSLPAYLVAMRRARRFVHRIASRLSPDIIHVNTTAVLAGAFLGRPGGARLVWHVHEIVVRPVALAWIFRAAPVVRADRVIAISNAVASWLTGFRVGRSKVVRIYNGIGVDDVPADTRGPTPVVAFVGRLNRWKGTEVFVDACAEIAPRHPDVTFRIVGDPPPGEEWRRAALEARAFAGGVGDRLIFDGYRTDVEALLAGVDILVVPSVWPEPFGLVIAEGMRAGCAVVATDHGGAPELLDDGQCGVLVPPNDAGALARAVEGLLVDPERRARLGTAARGRLRDLFGQDRFLDELEDLYQGMLG